MKAHYSAEQKQQVLTYLDNGMSVKDTSEKTGVGEQTIRNWKTGGKKTNGAGEPKKKAKKAAGPGESSEKRIREYSLWAHVGELETSALRRMLNESDKAKWPFIEIEYLREICKAFGHPGVKPLLEGKPEEKT